MTPVGGAVRYLDPHDDVRLGGRSLYDHVAGLLGAGGRGPLPAGGDPLPDDCPPEPGRLRWGAGSLDGLMAVRGSRSSDGEPLLAAAAVLAFLRTPPTAGGLRATAEVVTRLSGPQAMDRFLRALADGRPGRARTRKLGRWLCTQGVKRQQVKTGIALLGVFGREQDADLIAHLGMLEELTLYAAVALTNLLDDPDTALLDLADQVMGWGRIHCVHRLRASTKPEVARWLLHGGYENDVMVEETAYIVATTGGLRSALETDPDDELLDHAGALLAALAVGGPAEDMRDYADGGPALATYLDRMRGATATLTRLRHLRTLDRYLSRWVADNPRVDAFERRKLRSAMADVLARPEWPAVAESTLNGDDLQRVKYAIALVPRFGIDPVPVARRWLTRAPHDGYLWQTLLEAAGTVGEIRELVAQARGLLPFSAIPTGPADDLGLGPQLDPTHCLELILQRLRDFPGEGEEAILLGLRSRTTPCRNMALRAAATWPPASRPDALVDAVQAMAWSDRDTNIKKRARRITRGLPVD